MRPTAPIPRPARPHVPAGRPAGHTGGESNCPDRDKSGHLGDQVHPTPSQPQDGNDSELP
jgi:hypothetical protein